MCKKNYKMKFSKDHSEKEATDYLLFANTQTHWQCWVFFKANSMFVAL